MARWRALLQAPLDGATPIRLFETTQIKNQVDLILYATVWQGLKHASLNTHGIFRACQQFAASDYFPARRVMERVTIAGDRPYFEA